MKRMSQNFPNGGAMDTHFANMRSLIQVSLLNLICQTVRRGSGGAGTPVTGVPVIWCFGAGEDKDCLMQPQTDFPRGSLNRTPAPLVLAAFRHNADS